MTKEERRAAKAVKQEAAIQKTLEELAIIERVAKQTAEKLS